jgi:hypothetical protein
MTERESWETGLSERERRRFESDGAERRAERERATEQTRQIERLGDGAERRVNALFPVLFSLPFLFTVPCFVRNSRLCIVVCFFLFFFLGILFGGVLSLSRMWNPVFSGCFDSLFGL